MTTARPRPAPHPSAPHPSAPFRARRTRRPRPSSPALPLPRWIGILAVGSIAGFLPWIVYLGFTIPGKVKAQHYDLAWLGFDCGMWTVLAALAFCALRRHAATGPIAAVASMMLVVDAWFDVFTSGAQHGEMSFAIVLAFCGELPLAVLCGWAAVHAERVRTRAYHSLHERWERAVHGARQGAEEAVAVARVSRRPAPSPQR